MPTRPGLLDCIERYFAAAPLPDARIAAVGALDVPIGVAGLALPGAAAPGARPVTARRRPGGRRAAGAGRPARRPGVDLRALAADWPARPAPAGLAVEELPLLVAADPVELLLPARRPALPGRRRRPRAAALPAGRRASPSPTPGGAAPDVREAAAGRLAPRRPRRTAVLRERIAAGRTVMMVAVEDGEPVAVGSHHPVDVDGTEISEVVGVATLPRLRGRGLGAGLASALVAHARETADLVFLTAGDDDVARVYERVGFARLATAAVAERPPPLSVRPRGARRSLRVVTVSSSYVATRVARASVWQNRLKPR